MHVVVYIVGYQTDFMYVIMYSTLLVSCPDPTPKREKGQSGTLQVVPRSCWLNSYMTFWGWYTIFSNLRHLHVYTNIAGQC